MLKLAVIGTLAASALAQIHPVNYDIVNEIKEKTDRWTPADPEHNPLASKSFDEIMALMGTILSGPTGLPEPQISAEAPQTFDSREQWKECIHPIRDQAHCGSCWAFAASETLSDRFCIASEGKVNVVLSP